MKKDFLIQRDGKDFVLYAGLLDQAHQEGLKAITTALVQIPNELNGMVAICHATVETEKGTFTGLGDASPTNVTRMMAPHLIRMAETRAKARALRDAVNVGVTAVEELEDSESEGDADPDKTVVRSSRAAASNGTGRTPAARLPQASPVPQAPRPIRAEAPAGSSPALQEPDWVREDESPKAPAPAAAAPVLASGAREFHTPAAPAASTGTRAGGPAATPKQLQTIQRMARAAGKSIETDGLTMAQASEIISSLIGEMGQRRAQD